MNYESIENNKSITSASDGILKTRNETPYDFSTVAVDGIHIVDSITEHRINAIADIEYGNYDYGEYLQLYNNILDVTNIPIGTTILLPNVYEMKDIMDNTNDDIVTQQIAKNITINNSATASPISISQKKNSKSNVVRQKGRVIFSQKSTK